MIALTLALSLLAPQQTTDDQLVSWLKTAAIPISTTAPGTNLKDLAPLKTTLANVHIVGMGEATHGSREFFQMKYRMFQLLVQELGFEVFALEGSLPETVAMDRFVTKGDRDASY